MNKWKIKFKNWGKIKRKKFITFFQHFSPQFLYITKIPEKSKSQLCLNLPERKSKNLFETILLKCLKRRWMIIRTETTTMVMKWKTIPRSFLHQNPSAKVIQVRLAKDQQALSWFSEIIYWKKHLSMVSLKYSVLPTKEGYVLRRNKNDNPGYYNQVITKVQLKSVWNQLIYTWFINPPLRN